MRESIRIVGLFAVLATLAGRAAAEGDGEEAKAQPPAKAAAAAEGVADPVTRAIDRDGDRTISTEELKAAPAALLTLDRDRDGRLSRAECGTLRRGVLSSLDKDGDGRVSRDEASEGLKARFDELDTNGDGFLDVDEQAALLGRRRGGDGSGEAGPGKEKGPKRRPGSPVMSALDADDDGELSAEEIKNATTALTALDKDKDGRLSGDEIRPPKRSRGGFSFIARFDKDGDGKVSKAEAPAPVAERFPEMDLNGDGFIDDQELEKLREQRRGDADR